jgi:aspartate/methionine/tyrosine aminotransferase
MSAVRDLSSHPARGTAPRVAARAAAIPGSGIRAVAAAAWARPGTLHLELGEPAEDTPAHIVAAADRAARAGRTHYGPTAGLPEFREAVAEKLVRDNGWSAQDADPAGVVAAAGGVGALFAAYGAVLDEGDDILVPDPGWPNFAAAALAIGARPVRYPVDPSTGGAPARSLLDATVTPRTRAIVVNSPANPTGAVWSAAELAGLGDWAAGRGLWVISDECYDRLWFDAPAPGMRTGAPGAPTISIFSLSKSYAMTGWRLGYAVAPASVAGAMIRVQEALASCVSTVGQLAGVAALLAPQDSVERMRRSYAATLAAAVDVCERLGLRYLRPGGAFYLWLQVPDTVADVQAFAFDLVERHGVAVAPGTAFGPGGARSLRVSLAAARDEVTAGLTAIAAAFAETRP